MSGTEKIPDYMRVSRSGALYVDIDQWMKSPEREKQIQEIGKLRQWLRKRKG